MARDRAADGGGSQTAKQLHLISTTKFNVAGTNRSFLGTLPKAGSGYSLKRGRVS